MRLGLIGKDVSKSHSPKIHTFILKELGVECEYETMSVSPSDFDSAMRRLLGDFDGFNVTIPYKRDVMEYLDEIKGDALRFGAVNTVVCEKGAGYNTDGAGFLQMLKSSGVSIKDKKILVLGAGGSGRSTAVALKRGGAQVELFQRNQEKLLETCRELSLTPCQDVEGGGYDILVNCTGVGMHDKEGLSPVTKKAFLGASAAVDLIYEPKESEFLRLARVEGLKTVNGAAMLFYQAYFADCLYLGRKPDEGQAETLYEKYVRNG